MIAQVHHTDSRAAMRAIFDWEFLRFAAERRFFVFRTVMVAVPYFLALILASPDVGARDQSGRFIFWGTAWSLLILLTIMVPGYMSERLAREKAPHRLDVLRSTPVTMFGLVVAKWASQLALILLMCVAAFPVMASALLFGGVSSGDFVLVAGIILVAATGLSAVGLSAGSTTSDPAAAARRAYLTIGVLGLTSWIVREALAQPGPMAVTGLAAEAAIGLDPVSLLLWLQGGAALGVTWAAPALATFVTTATVVTVVALWRAVRNLTHEVAAVTPALAMRLDPRPARRDLVLRHPLVWLYLLQARRAPAGSRRRWLGLLFVVLGETWVCWRLFAVWIATTRGPTGEVARIAAATMATTSFTVAFLVAAVSGVFAFHRATRAEVSDLLHMSPVPTRDIVFGKLAAALSPAWIYWLLGLVQVVLASALGFVPWWGAPCFVAVTLPLIIGAAVIGMLSGIHSETAFRGLLDLLGSVVVLSICSLAIDGVLIAAAATCASWQRMPPDAFGAVIAHQPIFMAYWTVGAVQLAGPLLPWMVGFHVMLYGLLAASAVNKWIPDLYQERRRDGPLAVEFAL